MKNYLLSFALFATVPAIAQDVIHKHIGEPLNVKVISVNENSISYNYPGETATATIGKAAVSRIRFASGREESITPKVDVSGADGWKNVVVTNNPADVVGLRRLGDVKGKAGGYWGMRTVKGADKKASERIKKEAVEMGAHVVFMQQHETTGRKGYYSNPESIQSGAAYGY